MSWCMPGTVSAPPHIVVHVVDVLAGLASGALGSHPKVRAWLLDAGSAPGEDKRPELVLYVPGDHGAPLRISAPVRQARLGPQRWQVELADDGGQVILLRAPCDCGFGSVAYAGPIEARHIVQMVAVPSWVGPV